MKANSNFLPPPSNLQQARLPKPSATEGTPLLISQEMLPSVPPLPSPLPEQKGALQVPEILGITFVAVALAAGISYSVVLMDDGARALGALLHRKTGHPIFGGKSSTDKAEDKSPE